MSKELNYLGVDIGASSIKAVQLRNEGGRARLVTYGYSEHKVVQDGDILDNPEVVGKELAELCKNAGMTTKQAITGLPMSSVFSTLLTLSELPDKELEKQIAEKVKKLAPISEEDIGLDWKRVGEPVEKSVRVSVTAASKHTIDKYVRIFKIAGLELMNLETEAFAVIRALLGKDKSAALIVDIGSAKTSVLIAGEGVPLIHRTVRAGGNDLVKFIEKKMSVSPEEAEEIKKNLSVHRLENTDDLLRPLITPIVDEVKYCQELYSEQYNRESIEKMVLTGGSALIMGVPEALQKTLGFRIFIGDPWARIIYPDDLRPVLDKIGSRFAVAIGLAMREI